MTGATGEPAVATAELRVWRRMLRRLRCALAGRCPKCGAGLVGMYDTTYCEACRWGL